MTEATISQLKNHLPELVHRAEEGHDIEITRHGKPVAVMVSLERYNQVMRSGKGVFNAWRRWRELYPDTVGFTDEELDGMRDRAPHDVSQDPWD